jgi:hypothetical protein
MRTRQAGITFIGWIFLLIPVAIIGYAGIRLTPVYLNYMKVAKAITQTASEQNGDVQVSVTEVRESIERRFDVDGVNFPSPDVVTVQREGDTWVIGANYEDEVPMFAGISLLVKFDKRAVVN